MRKTRNKPTKAGAVELTEDELGQVAGGIEIKLQEVNITNQTVSGHGGVSQPVDPDLTNPAPKR